MNLGRCSTAILLCLLFLAGCGSPKLQEAQDNTTVDWKTNGFTVSGEIVDEQGLWVESHIRWGHEGILWNEETEANFPQLDAICWNGKMFQLYPIMVQPDATTVRGILEIFDTYNMEETVVELTQEQLGFQSTDSILEGMDVIGDGNYVFRTIEFGFDEDGQFVQNYNGVTYLESDGNVQRIDLLPVFLEKGLIEEDVQGISLDGECVCDAAGNSYFRSKISADLYILDKEGKFLMEYRGSAQELIGDPMKTEEGELIFPIQNNEERSTRLVWFDVDACQVRILADLKREWVKQLYGMQGNYLYYEGQSGIIRWNVSSGIRQLVFRFDENGIYKIYHTMLVMQEGKAPILRTYGTVNGEEEDWLVMLSEEPVERADAIRVASLKKTASRINDCTTAASRKNPDYSYILDEGQEKDLNDYRTQIVAELSAGRGPDLLYVSLEDMELLQKRGLLADLSTLLSEETLSKVIPGVIEMGTVDGTLVGMAPGITAKTLLIDKNIWSGDSWTIEDMVELMESGRIENKVLMSTGDRYYASLAVQRLLVNPNLENSFLIDWDKMESHFEDETFVRLLEYIGKYDPVPFEGTWDDEERSIGNLMIEIMLSSPSDISNFQGTRDLESYHYVGIPSDTGNGNYLYADGMLVVNKNLSDPAAVSAYLECLLGSEIQNRAESTGDGLPVTYSSVDDIRYDAETGEAWWKGYQLIVFEDGSTSLHEANAFLARCVPAPRTYGVLEQILYEELSAYNEELSRTAENTAKIIDNRIQLYLDEGN